jgi:hypothetical protein
MSCEYGESCDNATERCRCSENYKFSCIYYLSYEYDKLDSENEQLKLKNKRCVDAIMFVLSKGSSIFPDSCEGDRLHDALQNAIKEELKEKQKQTFESAKRYLDYMPKWKQDALGYKSE